MDTSYNLVAEKCAAQMAAYQTCVQNNQHSDWPNICRPQSDALASCADNAVPQLAEIKSTCAPHIEAYTACLRANAAEDDATVEQRCAGVIRDVWECSERIMREGKAEGR